MKNLYRAHPWHGVSAGTSAPHMVTVYVEIVPTDVMKYELDKESGILKLDRPNKYSSQCPVLYGFIPQTFCGDCVGRFAAEKASRSVLKGDGDPLDICVLAERPVQHGDILIEAKPIGGLRIIDRKEADDKIIAVLAQDSVYGSWNDLSDCPADLLARLEHYFLTYKQYPGPSERKVEIAGSYGREEAHRIISLSQQDYRERYP